MTAATLNRAEDRCPYCPHPWHEKPCLKTTTGYRTRRGRPLGRVCDCQTSGWAGGDDR